MPITLENEPNNVYRVVLRGVLKRRDMDRCQEALAREMGRVGPVRLLVVLDRFEGWSADDDWRDLTFYVKHGDAIERIAIVGQEAWSGGMLAFAGADLRRAPVEFFSEKSLAAARAWLTEGAATQGRMQTS